MSAALQLEPVRRPDLQPLFGRDVGIAFGDPRASWPPALPEEEEAIACAVAKRRAEFRAGRALARRAMAEIGGGPVAVPAGSDRAPQWPAGWTGSISHCDDLCGAVVARKSAGILSLGLDIEPAEPLEAELIPLIARPEEQARLRGENALLLARLLFSAKECAYKAQYPLSGEMLDFSDLLVTFDAAGGRFTARFIRDAGPFARGQVLEGFCVRDGAHWICGAVLSAGQGGRP